MAITYPRDLPDVPFESSRFALNVNQSSFGSAISRKIQIQQHAAGVTDRWEGLFTTPKLSVAQHRELTAWLISLRGREGTFLAGDPDRKTSRAGTLGNLASANSLDESSSAATPFGSVFGTKPLHIFDFKAGDAVSVTSLAKSSTGADQIRVVLIYLDENEVSIIQDNGNSVTSATYAVSAFVNKIIPAATKFLILLAQNIDTTETGFIKDIVMTRGATNSAEICTVMGASQTGRTLTVDRLSTSQNKLFLEGDYFTLEDVLYMLNEDVDSDGSGEATLSFDPALKTSPADNAQLLFENTTTTCRLLSNVAAWETDHIKTGPISFAWEEKI